MVFIHLPTSHTPSPLTKGKSKKAQLSYSGCGIALHTMVRWNVPGIKYLKLKSCLNLKQPTFENSG